LLVGDEHHNVPGSQAQEGWHEAVREDEDVTFVVLIKRMCALLGVIDFSYPL